MQSLITHVRYVGLAVEDFETERAFLGGEWGLEQTTASPDAAYFAARASKEPFCLRLRQAESRRTDLFALAVPARTDVDALFAHLIAKDVRIVRPPAPLTSPGGGYGFRFFDPDGRVVEISAEVALKTPQAVAHNDALPQGIAHAVFHTPDVQKTVDWYGEHLGMRPTDWLANAMCFLRGAGTKHHCLAFVIGHPALNHIAFEMADMDAMMRGLGRMLKHGIKLNWGPGRHVAGDNTFAYFVSPAGNILEYTAEIEHVSEDWIPRVLTRTEEMIDQWGTGRITGPGTYAAKAPDPGLWTAIDL
jgi:catechol 2,3-dioxygenase-like lactoylglutathione lyase family enzyme